MWVTNIYEDVLSIKKCLGYLMNKMQSKDHKIGTYEINKYSWLAVGCQS